MLSMLHVNKCAALVFAVRSPVPLSDSTPAPGVPVASVPLGYLCILVCVFVCLYASRTQVEPFSAFSLHYDCAGVTACVNG